VLNNPCHEIIRVLAGVLSGRAFTPAASRGNHDGILTSYNSRARPARSENAQRLMKVMSFLSEVEEVLLSLH